MVGTSNSLRMLATSRASFLTGSFPMEMLMTFDISIFVKTTIILTTVKFGGHITILS